jgi:hypothetical protein
MVTAKELCNIETDRPRLSRESQPCVLQRYSFGFEHITEEWVDGKLHIQRMEVRQSRLIVFILKSTDLLVRELKFLLLVF